MKTTTIALSERDIRARMGEYYGEITEDLDKHLCDGGGHPEYGWRTYIMHHTDNKDGSTIWIFRVPGATRGRIIVDNKDIIVEFEVYNETGDCYEEAVSEVCNKYIGYELVIESLAEDYHKNRTYYPRVLKGGA